MIMFRLNEKDKKRKKERWREREKKNGRYENTLALENE